MVGRALFFVFGIPSIIGIFIFTKKGMQNECVVSMGSNYCGSALYLYSAIFALILLMVLFLVYIWRD